MDTELEAAHLGSTSLEDANTSNSEYLIQLIPKEIWLQCIVRNLGRMGASSVLSLRLCSSFFRDLFLHSSLRESIFDHWYPSSVYLDHIVPPKENPFSHPSYDLLRRAVFLESLSRSSATCHPAAYKLPYDAANQLKSYMQSLGFLDQNYLWPMIPDRIKEQRELSEEVKNSREDMWEILMHDFYQPSTYEPNGNVVQWAFSTAIRSNPRVDTTKGVRLGFLMGGADIWLVPLLSGSIGRTVRQTLADFNINGMDSFLFDDTFSWLVFHTIDFGFVAGNSAYTNSYYKKDMEVRRKALKSAKYLLDQASKEYRTLADLSHFLLDRQWHSGIKFYDAWQV